MNFFEIHKSLSNNFFFSGQKKMHDALKDVRLSDHPPRK